MTWHFGLICVIDNAIVRALIKLNCGIFTEFPLTRSFFPGDFVTSNFSNVEFLQQWVSFSSSSELEFLTWRFCDLKFLWCRVSPIASFPLTWGSLTWRFCDLEFLRLPISPTLSFPLTWSWRNSKYSGRTLSPQTIISKISVRSSGCRCCDFWYTTKKIYLHTYIFYGRFNWTQFMAPDAVENASIST